MDIPIAAIDVGSGMTKFVIAVAKLQADSKPIIDVLHQVEKPIPYGVDWKSSPDGCLSQNIQLEGLKLLRNINEIIAEWNEKNRSKYSDITVIGVGTEVFRKAKNGEDFLKRIESEANIKIDMISQEKEAQIGFRTGEAALLTIDKDVLKNQFDYDHGSDLAVYDSGGGSFQITWADKTVKESKPFDNGDKLKKILKPNGLAPTLHDLLTLQNRKSGSSPNPVSLKTAMDLVDSLISKYIDPRDIEQLKDESYNTMFLSIGGINSHVRLAADVIKRLEFETNVTNVDEDLEKTKDSKRDLKLNVTPLHFSFTEESVTKALERICDKHDNELEIFAYYDNAEPVSYMVPKLCILLSVLKGYNISKLNWILCCGSCFGLILDHCDKFNLS